MVPAHISSFLTLHIWAEDDSCRRGLWLRCCLSISAMQSEENMTHLSQHKALISRLRSETVLGSRLLKRSQEHNLVLTVGKYRFQWWLFSRGHVEGIGSCRSPNTLPGHCNEIYWRVLLEINCSVQWEPEWLTSCGGALLFIVPARSKLLLWIYPQTCLSNKRAFFFFSSFSFPL